MGLFDAFWTRRKQRELDTRAIDAVEELRADMRRFELEWADVYQKIAKVQRKLAKAAERAEKDCGCEDGGSGNGASAGESPAAVLARARSRYGDPWGGQR